MRLLTTAVYCLLALPCTRSESVLRLLIGSDFHIEGGGIHNTDDAQTIDLVRTISANHTGGIPSAFILLGDLIDGHDESDASLHSLVEAVHPDVARMVLFGNHDGNDQALSVKQRNMLRMDELAIPGHSLSRNDASTGMGGLIDTTIRGVRLIGLDSGGKSPSSSFVKAYDTAPTEALERMMASPANERCTLAFMHIPPCEVAGAVESGKEADWRGTFFEKVSPSRPNRRGVWDKLSRIKVRHVFSGHDHCNYGYLSSGGMNLYFTGRAGYAAYKCRRSPAPQLLDLTVNTTTCAIKDLRVRSLLGVDYPYPSHIAEAPLVGGSKHEFRKPNVVMATWSMASGYFVALVITIFIACR